MNTIHSDPSLSNPATVTEMLAALLAAGPQPQPPPALTYLRRKAGRGLVAVYGTARDPGHLYTVTVEEDALTVPAGDGVTAGWEPHWQGAWPGVVADPALGLAVQAFPTDRTLPALAAAMDPATDPQLWVALQSAGSASVPGTAEWTLDAVRAEPVRYKPGDRCVIRYRLVMLRPGPGGPRGAGVDEQADRAEVSVIGKLYREQAQAVAADALLARLRTSSAGDWCPAPLGRVDPLALLLSEDLGDQRSNPPTRPGPDVIHPGNPHSAATIAAAGRALAGLHTSDTVEPGTPFRRGTDEADKAAKRAQVLSAYLPSLAVETTQIGREVCDRLRSLHPDQFVPAHGSYKPSQLLVRDGSVFLVDFDQFCQADPALDVGYFMAYLRPPGLFYDRRGTRDWFDTAAETFRNAYLGAQLERGATTADTASILSRSSVYEAALLLKIAARRPNRLHSPRPGEVHALWREITGCLRTAELV
jgi:hypothetical protein